MRIQTAMKKCKGRTKGKFRKCVKRLMGSKRRARRSRR